jgi:hypothetical protein
MSKSESKRDWAPLRPAVWILCGVILYVGVVFVIASFWQRVSEPINPYPNGSRYAADFAHRYPVSPRLLIFDRSVTEDFKRRLIVAVLLLVGSGGLLIGGRLISRHRSRRSTLT